MDRRELLRAAFASGLFVANALQRAQGQAPGSRYSLLLKGGRVIDPSQGLNGVHDVAISDGRIAAVGPDISPRQAAQTVNVDGQIITPGLVDLHVHGFEGISHWGINLDHHCVTRGVTTAVDAGTAGADSFDGFRTQVIGPSRTRILAFLNISRVGLVGQPGELVDTRMIDEASALRVAKKHHDVIVGIKVRCGANLTGPNDLQAVRSARKVADVIHKPLMIHVGRPYSPTEEILKELRPGDILTHAFRAAGTGGVTAADGKVPGYILKAAERGILFDIGHGAGAFSFATAEEALKRNLLPTSISSDIHAHSALGPVFDLATTLSKFLLLGVPLEKIIELATVAPARAISRADIVGSLKPGRSADVAVFDLVQGDFSFVDSVREIRKFNRKLVPAFTLRDGGIP
jgi:dihydroorotase